MAMEAQLQVQCLFAEVCDATAHLVPGRLLQCQVAMLIRVALFWSSCDSWIAVAHQGRAGQGRAGQGLQCK